MVVAPQNASGRLAGTALIGMTVVREEAEKARTQARDAVVLLEQPRTLLAKDNARQLAIKYTDEAISEAERRAAMLEDWYRRTYSTPHQEMSDEIRKTNRRSSKQSS
jgi:hypothetical protein